MKIQFYLYVFLTSLFFFSCLSASNQKSKFQADWDVWLSAFNNSDTTGITEQYLSKSAILINNELVQSDSILGSFLLKNLKTDNFKISQKLTLKIFEHDSARFMETGYFVMNNENPRKIYFITAWLKKNNAWKREVDIFYSASENEIDTTVFSDRKRDWVRFSNAHDAAQLINNLYHTDAFYLSKGRLDRGTEAITARYRYMDKPTWTVDLKSSAIIPVSDTIVYEIGRWVTKSKSGYFLIVWQYRAASWKILIDFNF